MPRKVAMKNLVTIRLLSSLMFEPTSGLLTAYLDRVEGKVPDNINMGISEETRSWGDTMVAIYGRYLKDHPDEIPTGKNHRGSGKRSKPKART
jgi:hypothetical protein